VLAQSYVDLPADEQQKDIDQMRVLQGWLEAQQNPEEVGV